MNTAAFSHARTILLTILMVTSCLLLSATLIVNENIQSWSAHTSYGIYTQEIPAGFISMSNCLVSPGAAANGAGSIGRVQFQAATGILQFPEFSSLGDVEFTFSAGSTGRSVKLQQYVNSTWTDLVTFSGITATGSRFFYHSGQNNPVMIRLAMPSHAIYMHDILITDYQNSAVPVISTPIAGTVTYNSAQVSAVIESAGSAPVTTRGFCWSTAEMPDTTSAHISLGSGISPMQTTIMGLQPETDYFIRAYALNSGGLAFSPQIMIHTATIGIPTIQTTNLVLYPGNTSIQASWTPGDGSRRLIVINTQNSFDLPVDGTEYTPFTVYSGTGQQVIYCDATQEVEGDQINDVTVTGLIRNTTYWFRAFEMNGTGTSAMYLTPTSVGNPASTTTLNTGLAGYYDNISGYGAELKAELHDLVRTSHLNQFSYSAVWQQLQYTDEDSLNTNNIIETYTGWSLPKNNYGSGTTQWNREHTWSTSHGGFETNRPAGTDLHHLRPCDVTVNSAKGNKDFDIGGTPYIDASPYGSYSATTGCNADPDSWEPRPIEKGDVARMLLYMAVRYEGTDTGYNLEMQDLTPTAGSYYGKLSTLLQWHYDDPPDSWERRRNDRIQERQGNRNPFIDHPEYVTAIWAPHITRSLIMMEDYFHVFWTHAVNAISYSIDVSPDSLFSTFLVQNYDTGYADAHTFNITETDTVFVRVRPFYGSGYGQYSNTLRVVIQFVPAVISSFDVTLLEDYTAKVEWTATTENLMLGYNVLRSETNELSSAAQVNAEMIPANNSTLPSDYSFIDTSLPAGNFSGWLYYWLQGYTYSDDLYWGPDSLYIEPSAVTDENQGPVPALLRAYPNPFVSYVNVEYSLKEASPLNIQIYNLKGQRIKSWQGNALAGKNSYVWDGRDESGQSTSAGIYLLKLSTPMQQQITKLLKL
jgi:endonuclease I